VNILGIEHYDRQTVRQSRKKDMITCIG
jgi:hypothetical protein